MASNYAAAAEHIEHGASALLADYDDPRHFGEQTSRLLGHPALASAMRVAARSAAEKIDWACVVRAMEAVLWAAAQTAVSVLCD